MKEKLSGLRRLRLQEVGRQRAGNICVADSVPLKAQKGKNWLASLPFSVLVLSRM